MPVIHLTTFIEAPAQRVFDLSRSIDFHQKSMQQTNEKAIDGVTTGLIKLNQRVTWQAKHLFKTRQFETMITAMEPCNYFEDAMVRGDFISVRHKHHFKQVANGTIMIDLFTFETPYKQLGKFINWLFLTRYMKRLLLRRNDLLRQYAETAKWQTILVQKEPI
jgi:ligand-binding SRPBCC domain-containing protein